MKAIVRYRYGSPDLVQFAEVPEPVLGDDQVRIKLYAASMNPLDRFLMQGFPWNRLPGLRTPKVKVLGCDIAGRVESVGSRVLRFHPGDEVFGISGFQGNGFAEYVCAQEASLAPKPAGLSFEQAAAMPVAAVTALQAVRDHARVQPGQRVLIEGASGGVGTFAVQLAKAFRAEVTAVVSSRHIDLVRSLGADHGIDYALEDFTRSGLRYDVILAINAHHPLTAYRRALAPDGVCVVVGGKLATILAAWLLGPLLSRAGRKKARFFVAKIHSDDLAYLAELAEAGKLDAVIDRRYPLRDAADAMRYLAQGHARGKIVLQVGSS